MAQKRQWWKDWQWKMWRPTVRRLVFLDESGTNINMSRSYGRAVGAARVVDNVPFSKPKNTTIVSTMRLDGSIAYSTYEGGTKRENFIAYLKDTRLPTLKPWDIVVMDNLRTHHMEEVRTVLAESKILLMYLPPYSPDLNPIEMLWSKVKAFLRKVKKRTVEALTAAIEQAMQQITPEDCKCQSRVRDRIGLFQPFYGD